MNRSCFISLPFFLSPKEDPLFSPVQRVSVTICWKLTAIMRRVQGHLKVSHGGGSKFFRWKIFFYGRFLLQKQSEHFFYCLNGTTYSQIREIIFLKTPSAETFYKVGYFAKYLYLYQKVSWKLGQKWKRSLPPAFDTNEISLNVTSQRNDSMPLGQARAPPLKGFKHVAAWLKWEKQTEGFLEICTVIQDAGPGVCDLEMFSLRVSQTPAVCVVEAQSSRLFFPPAPLGSAERVHLGHACRSLVLQSPST